MNDPVACTPYGSGRLFGSQKTPAKMRHLSNSLRKCLALCCIVKPLGINPLREVIALPGNGAPKGFDLIDMIAIAELLADTAGIDHDILGWIEALPAQLLRYPLRGQGY